MSTKPVTVEVIEPVATVVVHDDAAPEATVTTGTAVVVTDETVRRVNKVLETRPSTVVVGGTGVTTGVGAVEVDGKVIPTVPAKPGEFIGPKKSHHGSGLHGRKEHLATVETERALLDDVARHRAALVASIDELHTRLSPKYQVSQFKSSWKTAGLDALGILKNEGAPVDETRKKKAETILKAGGGLSGLLALHGLRKLLQRAKRNRELRKAVAKGMPAEHLEIVGLVEELKPEHLPAEIEISGSHLTDSAALAQAGELLSKLKFHDAEVVPLSD